MRVSIKRVMALVLTFCIMAGVSVVNIPVFAGTVVKNISLTGDITPSVNEKLKFATAEANLNYTVIQMWYDNEKKTMFTDNDLLNGQAEAGGTLMPENERCFKEGKMYWYCVMLIPNTTDITFDTNLTVSVGEYSPFFMPDTDGVVAYMLLFAKEGEHLHVSSPDYGKDSTYHRIKCRSNDGYSFNGFTEKHDVTVENGVCSVCGYKVPDSSITKITKQPVGKSVSCGETIELSVAATGEDLEYCWYSEGYGYLGDTDNFKGIGTRISGSKTSALKIENFNCNTEKLTKLYCLVRGLRGDVKSETVTLAVTPKASGYVPISIYKHKSVCNCENVLGNDDHSYADGKCKYCGFVQGSSLNEFSGGTIEIPNFTAGLTVEDAMSGMTFKGTGLKSGDGLDKTKSGFYSRNSENYLEKLPPDHVFEKDCNYIVYIFPLLEDNFIVTASMIGVYIDGIRFNSLTQISNKGEYYFTVGQLKPEAGTELTFDAGGGTGTQEAVYADLQKYVYFPECTFTKKGDEFFAWRYNGTLYYPDPKKETPVKITDGAVATAVWKSQLIKDVPIKMECIENGDTVSDVVFSVPESADYTVSSSTWYKGDTVSNIYKLSDTSELSADSNYTVRVVLKSGGFAPTGDMNISLNGKPMTDTIRQGAQVMAFTVHIINNVSVKFDEPTDGNKLAQYSDITAEGSKFTVSVDTCWTADEAGKVPLAKDIKAKGGENYYLLLKLNQSAGNHIFGGNTVKINGVSCKVSELSADCVVCKVKMTALKQKITISEDSDGMLSIKSSKDTNVVFIAAYYGSDRKLKDMIIQQNMQLKNGENEVNIAEININKAISFVTRKSSEYVKIMVLDSFGTLEPLAAVHRYKYIMK